ncbi:MAG TPA: hypothetical protein V6C89_10155 [Drouetiella sp.]
MQNCTESAAAVQLKFSFSGLKVISGTFCDLGITTQQLQNWVNKHRRDVKLASANNQMSLVEENAELRRQLAEAKEANEILKKAAAYFAKSL